MKLILFSIISLFSLEAQAQSRTVLPNCSSVTNVAVTDPLSGRVSGEKRCGFIDATGGKFNIYFYVSDAIGAASVSVSNDSGEPILERSWTGVGNVLVKQIELGNVPKGNYLVEVKAGKERIERTIVVK